MPESRARRLELDAAQRHQALVRNEALLSCGLSGREADTPPPAGAVDLAIRLNGLGVVGGGFELVEPPRKTDRGRVRDDGTTASPFDQQERILGAQGDIRPSGARERPARRAALL